MPSEQVPVSTSFARLQAWIFVRTEQFVSGRNWVVKTTLLCVVFSVLFSGGIDFGLADRGGYPASYFKKIEHPLLDIAKISSLYSHDANINFRLTVPVILHALGVHSSISLPLLTIAAIYLILVASCLVAYQLTQDRVCACFIALNVSATYVGSFGFIWYYDAIAISQIALAALPTMPWWLRGVLVFSASFTDERAFAASGLILAAYFFLPVSRRTFANRLRQPNFLAVAAAMFFYVVTRIVLMKIVGLTSPTGGCGLGCLLFTNLNRLHPALWFALEGGWLLFGLALTALFVNKERMSVMGLALATFGFLGFALMIGDVLRSTIYVFPLLFISLAVLSRNELLTKLRSYCLLAFLISAIGGNYNVYLEKITWFQPLTIRGLQLLGQAIYASVYSWLPHALPASP